MVRHVEGEGELVLDTRFLPVAIATWLGEAHSTNIDRYYGWIDDLLARAEAAGTTTYLVVDALDVVRPTAESRRRFSYETKVRIDRLERWNVGIVVVARGAVLLGMVSAMAAALGGKLRLTTAGTTPKGLQRALDTLEATGVSLPAALEPARYERPGPSGGEQGRR